MDDLTPKPTAEERVIELTHALKVVDEMRRQNLARVDDAARKAFEKAAEMADEEGRGYRDAAHRLAFELFATKLRDRS